MVSAWRLRSFPVLLLVLCVVASTVEGTNAGGASSRGGGQDRRNAANRQRRSTTPDPHEESPTSPFLAEGSHAAMPAPWRPETEERTRHGNSVKVTRKTKSRKNGTYAGHVAVTMETGLSTTGTLPLATDHVIPSSDMVTASGGGEGTKRVRPGGGKSLAVTRTSAETTESMQRTTDASITQRNHRVKTAATTTTYPTTTPTTTTPTTTTPTTTTMTTTAKLPARKQSTTTTSARTVPFGGRTSSTTRYSNRTTSNQGSSKGEGCSSSCEMHRCETVEAEMCQGRVVKDRCNCCPVCFVEPRSTDESREDVTTRKTSHQPSNACDGMQCPKHKVCILNIQGIPMCRCPNIYSCKGIDRNPLCAQNGMTYKNKCFLKVDECTFGRRIRIEHRGSCRFKPTPAQFEPSAMMWKTSRYDSDHRTQQATHQRKSGKNDPWRHAATKSDKTKFTRLRKRTGNKSQFS